MSSWNDRRQSSIVTMSGWPTTRMVVRNLPPNMREVGGSTRPAYLCSCMSTTVSSSGAYYVVPLSYLNMGLARLRPVFEFLHVECWPVHVGRGKRYEQLFIEHVEVGIEKISGKMLLAILYTHIRSITEARFMGRGTY